MRAMLLDIVGNHRLNPFLPLCNSNGSWSIRGVAVTNECILCNTLTSAHVVSSERLPGYTESRRMDSNLVLEHVAALRGASRTDLPSIVKWSVVSVTSAPLRPERKVRLGPSRSELCVS